MKTKTFIKLLLAVALLVGVGASTVVFSSTEATAKVTKKKKKRPAAPSKVFNTDPFNGVYSWVSKDGNEWRKVDMNLHEKKTYIGNDYLTFGYVENRIPGLTDGYNIVEVIDMSENEANVLICIPFLGLNYTPDDCMVLNLKYNPVKQTLRVSEVPANGDPYLRPLVLKRIK